MLRNLLSKVQATLKLSNNFCMLVPNFFLEDDFFLPFPENRLCHYMHIVSYEDNLHEVLKPVFWGEKIKMSLAEIFTQSAKH